MRRASVDTIERFMKDVTASKSDYVRDRRLSLTMMNCIWARNTDEETDTPVEGEVTGCVPEWLEGCLFRVGPGIFQVGNSCYNHPFDMTSVLHKYTLNPKTNCFLYQNKIIHSKTSKTLASGIVGESVGLLPGLDPSDVKALHKACAKNIRPRFSRDPFKSKLQRFSKLFNRSTSLGNTSSSMPSLLTRKEIKDTCMENIMFIADQMFLLSDNSIMLKVDPDNLVTVSQIGIDELAPVVLASAHPHIDEDGTVWNIGTSHHRKSGFVYSVFKFEANVSQCEPLDSDGKTMAKLVATIPSRDKNCPSYYHTFGLTADYIIFIEQPLFVESHPNGLRAACGGVKGPSEAASGSSGDESPEPEPLHHRLKWRRNEMVRFYVLSRQTGQRFPTTFCCKPFFFFHIINSFQRGNSIVIDLVAYKDADILSDLKFSHIQKTDRVPSGNVIRIVLPLDLADSSSSSTMSVKAENLVPENLEFPRFNYNYLGQKYQFFYALGNDYLHPNKIYKVDTDSRDVLSWKEPGYFVSEPVFVARPGSSKEDDGVVLFTLLSTSNYNQVQIIILNAETLTELSRIRFFAEGTVTEGFHGIFVLNNGGRKIY